MEVIDQTFRTVLDRTDIAQSTCEILRLVLGPLHLDLLGLQVDLNRVVLVITAEQGPGNLLGNLLCALAGLLDGGLIHPTDARKAEVRRDVPRSYRGHAPTRGDPLSVTTIPSVQALLPA